MTWDFLLVLALAILGAIVIGQAFALSDLRDRVDATEQETAKSFVALCKAAELALTEAREVREHVVGQEKRVIAWMEKVEALCRPISETLAAFGKGRP